MLGGQKTKASTTSQEMFSLLYLSLQILRDVSRRHPIAKGFWPVLMVQNYSQTHCPIIVKLKTKENTSGRIHNSCLICESHGLSNGYGWYQGPLNYCTVLYFKSLLHQRQLHYKTKGGNCLVTQCDWMLVVCSCALVFSMVSNIQSAMTVPLPITNVQISGATGNLRGSAR